MPNPLSFVRPNAHFYIAPGAICQRPQLALRSLQVISAWANAEYQIGSLLATVIGAESLPVIMDAINKRSAVKQREMLADHGKERLGEEKLDLLSTFLVLAGRGQKARNPLVHWLSGFSDDLPDAVLYTNPTDWWRWEANLQAFKANPEGRMPEIDRAHIQVYVERDFGDSLRDIGQLLEAGGLINFLLNWPGGLPGPGRVYSRLLAVPQFREALEKTREDRQKEQEAPQQ